MVGQVIRRLLGGVLPWLLAGLLGVAVYQHMQAQRYAAERDAAETRAAREEERAEILLEHQRWQRNQIDAMTAALHERDTRMARDTELMNLVRRAARQLERDDAETAEWADEPMPGAVRVWLRDLSADAAAGDEPTMRGNTAVPDRAAGSATE